MRSLFLFYYLARLVYGQELLEDLQCDANITIGATFQSAIDTNALLTLDTDTIPILLSLDSLDFRALYTIQISLPSVQVFAYADTNTTQTLTVIPLNWSQLLPAVTTFPGNMPACQGIPGCDGFILNTALFMRLFVPAAKFYILRLTVDFFQTTASSSRHLLAALIGSSDSLELQMQFTEAQRTRAFGSDVTTGFQYLVWVIIGSVLFVGIGCLLMALYSTPATKRQPESQSLIVEESKRRNRPETPEKEEMEEEKPKKKKKKEEAIELEEEEKPKKRKHHHHKKKITEEQILDDLVERGIWTEKQAKKHVYSEAALYRDFVMHDRN
jgi:hypothetical protein